MLSSALPKVRCRPIQESDLERLADLLSEGFPDRSRNYWTKGLARLARCPAPADFPPYGYMLDVEGTPVGVLLLIYTGQDTQGDPTPMFNVSSWYVQPAFRSHASLLGAVALKRKDVIYLNASPVPHSLPTLKAVGYQPLTVGQMLCAPALSLGGGRCEVLPVEPAGPRAPFADLPELDLLRAHAEQGCLSLVCREDGVDTPIVLLPRRLRRSPLKVAQLIYCRQTSDFVRHAGAIGRYLLGRGYLLALCDANAPIPGLVGHYFAGKAPKFFKGPRAPRINDLSFTEAVIFGP